MDYNADAELKVLQGIAELPSFVREADKLLDAEERQDLICYLAGHPHAGDLMQGTGGVRKLRWRRGCQGKRGGVRVIYYFHDPHMPLYLLTLFAKGDRANLDPAERHALATLTRMLVTTWTQRRTS